MRVVRGEHVGEVCTGRMIDTDHIGLIEVVLKDGRLIDGGVDAWGYPRTHVIPDTTVWLSQDDVEPVA